MNNTTSPALIQADQVIDRIRKFYFNANAGVFGPVRSLDQAADAAFGASMVPADVLESGVLLSFSLSCSAMSMALIGGLAS